MNLVKLANNTTKTANKIYLKFLESFKSKYSILNTKLQKFENRTSKFVGLSLIGLIVVLTFMSVGYAVANANDTYQSLASMNQDLTSYFRHPEVAAAVDTTVSSNYTGAAKSVVSATTPSNNNPTATQPTTETVTPPTNETDLVSTLVQPEEILKQITKILALN